MLEACRVNLDDNEMAYYSTLNLYIPTVDSDLGRRNIKLQKQHLTEPKLGGTQTASMLTGDTTTLRA